jgi:hypothetical protein
VAIVLFMREQSQKLSVTNWLDGAIAGCGAAAACAALALHGVLQSSATAMGTVVNLALPIGDALLLGLIVGGFAVLSGTRRAPWILLATGMALNVVGDASNVLQYSLGATSFGRISNAVAWPIAIVLMSMAVWLRPKPVNPLMPQSRPGFLLPILAAAALGILFAGTFYSIGRVAIALSTMTLVVVGIRFPTGGRAGLPVGHRRRGPGPGLRPHLTRKQGTAWPPRPRDDTEHHSRDSRDEPMSSPWKLGPACTPGHGAVEGTGRRRLSTATTARGATSS